MRKTKEIAADVIEIIEKHVPTRSRFDDFIDSMAEIVTEMAVNDIEKMVNLRNAKTNEAILNIFLEQRRKHQAVCRIVNKSFPDFLNVEDFDMWVVTIYPGLETAYRAFVLSKEGEA